MIASCRNCSRGDKEVSEVKEGEERVRRTHSVSPLCLAGEKQGARLSSVLFSSMLPSGKDVEFEILS
jgi:hypothetical protein